MKQLFQYDLFTGKACEVNKKTPKRPKALTGPEGNPSRRYGRQRSSVADEPQPKHLSKGKTSGQGRGVNDPAKSLKFNLKK